jgi:hypothetical protein
LRYTPVTLFSWRFSPAFSIQLQWLQVSSINIKFAVFTVHRSLVFMSTASHRSLKWKPSFIHWLWKAVGLPRSSSVCNTLYSTYTIIMVTWSSGCETLSHIKGRIKTEGAYWPWREEPTRCWRKLCNKELHNL